MSRIYLFVHPVHQILVEASARTHLGNLFGEQNHVVLARKQLGMENFFVEVVDALDGSEELSFLAVGDGIFAFQAQCEDAFESFYVLLNHHFHPLDVVGIGVENELDQVDGVAFIFRKAGDEHLRWLFCCLQLFR